MKILDFFDFSFLNNVTSKLILTCQLYELAKDQAMFLVLQVRIEFLVGTGRTEGIACHSIDLRFQNGASTLRTPVLLIGK